MLDPAAIRRTNATLATAGTRTMRDRDCVADAISRTLTPTSTILQG
jgi:hypothetical protein